MNNELTRMLLYIGTIFVASYIFYVLLNTVPRLISLCVAIYATFFLLYWVPTLGMKYFEGKLSWETEIAKVKFAKDLVIEYGEKVLGLDGYEINRKIEERIQYDYEKKESD